MLPGFRLTLGLTMAWIGLLVLLPLTAVGLRAIGVGWSEFWALLFRPYVLSAFKVSYLTSLYAALFNVFFGVLVAWVLVRYRFPGRRLLDGLVDLDPQLGKVQHLFSAGPVSPVVCQAIGAASLKS